MEVLAGIDIGGGGTRVAILSIDGEARATISSSYPESEVPEGPDFLIQLIELATADANADQIVGIGIGASGPVDADEGTIDNPYTLPPWLQGQIRDPLALHFDVPVVLDNDANAAALGEYWRGSGRGSNRLLCVTVGTGIGVAFLRQGVVERSGLGGHGEAGHHLIDSKGPVCYCGAKGCWESLCSGSAIARIARAHRFTPGVKEFGADVVVAAARSGDPKAQRVIEEVATNLGRGLVNAVSFLMPDQIILGGSVMEGYDLFRGRIAEVLRAHATMIPCSNLDVVPAQLGASAGMIGAAYSALQMSTSKTLGSPARLQPSTS